jgi:hypothetical protein
MIAAVLSYVHCGPVNTMLDMYLSGDPYLAFAKRVGAMPSWATKTSHADVRDKYKVMLLATQYGMAAETLAGRLGVSTFEAHEMLNQHRELFAQYWCGPTIGYSTRCRRAPCAQPLGGPAALESLSLTNARSATGRFRRPAPTFEDCLHSGGTARHQDPCAGA